MRSFSRQPRESSRDGRRKGRATVANLAGDGHTESDPNTSASRVRSSVGAFRATGIQVWPGPRNGCEGRSEWAPFVFADT